MIRIHCKDCHQKYRTRNRTVIRCRRCANKTAQGGFNRPNRAQIGGPVKMKVAAPAAPPSKPRRKK